MSKGSLIYRLRDPLCVHVRDPLCVLRDPLRKHQRSEPSIPARVGSVMGWVVRVGALRDPLGSEARRTVGHCVGEY